jgi:hypothetical protein
LKGQPTDEKGFWDKIGKGTLIRNFLSSAESTPAAPRAAHAPTRYLNSVPFFQVLLKNFI